MAMMEFSPSVNSTIKKDIKHVIDFVQVDSLLEGFNKSTGFVTAIVDLEGNVLSKSGWRQICTEFHRINPETSKRCTVSDTELANKMAEGEKYHFYKCLNGLVDVAVPVVINGEHIANLFSGQFFFDEPDISFFKEQAKRYGFDEEKYFAALKKVPVVSGEKVKITLDFLLDMTRMISDMAFQKLELEELNKNLRESEEKFKAVFESANTGKSITLPTGEISVNSAFCEMLGYSREELHGKKWQDLTPADEIPAVESFINSLLTGEKNSARFEKRYICKDGSCIWTDVSVSLRRDNNGNPLHFITTVIDITESKQAEQQTIEAKQKAEESENIFRGIFESHSAAVAIIEADTTISMVNESYCKLSGYTREEVIGMSWTKQIPPDDLERLKEYNRIRLLNPAEAPSEYEFTFYHKNGAIKHAMMSVGIISGTKKIIVSFNDITERKQAEEALRESQEKFSNAFQTSAYAITITRAEDGEFIEINDAFILITGYTREEALADSSIGLKLWANEEDRENVVADLRAGRRVEGREYQFRTKSGKNITCLFSAQIMRLSAGLCVLSSINDITESKQAEMFAIKERAISDAIIESTPGTFYMLDENGRYARWSAYQRDEIVGKPDSMMPDTNAIDTIHPEDRDLIGSRIKNVLINGVVETVEGRVLLHGGPDFRWLLMTGRRIVIEEKPYLLGIGIDITERKQAEEKIRESGSLIRIAAEKAKLGGWNVDLKEYRSYWSDVVAAIHEMPVGYAPLVQDGINFYAPEWRERITKVFTDCALNGIPYDEEMEIITSTGKRVWVRTIGEAVRDENGRIFKVQGAFQDISEKKIAEAKIREKDIQFRKLSANVPDLIYRFTRKPDGSYYVPIASEGIKNIFGCSPEDVIDDFTPIANVLFPEDAERVIRDIEYSAEHLTYFTCEFRVLIPGKPVQWIFSRSTPEKLPDGSVTWYGFNTNITERKLAEEELKRQLDELKRWQEVTLGREDRNRQLKQEVNELLTRFGETIRYPSIEAIHKKHL
ncbi:MAG: PAS domain S-box protein [Ignavibacteriaceae bacterium]